MRALHRIAPLALSFLALAAAADPTKERPVAPGWTSPETPDYEAGIDHKIVHTGHGSLYLKATGPAPKDFSVRQVIRADAYHAKRIKLSAWVRADQGEEGGAIWLRVDFKNGDYVLDGMLELKMTKDWTKCELVAEVPDDALGISFGVRMRGKGEFRADDLAIDVVPKSVPTTTIERRPYRLADKDAAIQRLKDQYVKAPLHPVNLGFEN